MQGFAFIMFNSGLNVFIFFLFFFLLEFEFLVVECQVICYVIVIDVIISFDCGESSVKEVRFKIISLYEDV